MRREGKRKAQLIQAGGVFSCTVREYAPRDDVMRRDNDEMHDLKHAIFDTLTEAERNVLIAYAEAQSYSELARLLRVGRTTAFDEVQRIRYKIIAYMKERGHDYGDNYTHD